MFRQLLEFIMKPWTRFKQHRAYKKRLEELRKRDPFIYK